jgi:lysine 2,3-aminomutase
MPDTIQQIGNSLIQHGPDNDRVYIMKLDRDDTAALLKAVKILVQTNHYSKIFAKVPDDVKSHFENAGYEVEAHVPGFFNGSIDAWFMGRFLTDQRKIDFRKAECDAVRKAAQTRNQESPATLPGSDYHCRLCQPDDARDMAEVYRRVFETYPFPIHDPNYLRQTMASHIAYFGIWRGDKLVALSSAEMDVHAQNVEMTDFATLPEYRGKKLAAFLLARMEQEMKNRDIKTAYTIARAPSFGMNITFARLGYRYAGRLINNTNIAGGFESMTVWHKPL